MIYLEHNDEKCDRHGIRYILRPVYALMRRQAVMSRSKSATF